MSEHTCGCGCCASDGDCCHTVPETRLPIVLDAAQKEFLVELSMHGYLPLTRFVRTCAENDEVYLVALAPVYLVTAADTMETVKETGAFLSDMESAGLISLDYGEPLSGYAYPEYTASALFSYFCDTVREGVCESARKGTAFHGDTPELELGSISITELGTRSLAVS